MIETEKAAPTWAACLTPPGLGAIASLAVRGPNAWEMARTLFQSKQLLSESPEAGRFWLGRLGKEIADEVVLAVKRTMPTVWLEVHCHGGREVVRLLLETFEEYGAKTCSWQDLERRTGNNPLRALAAAELVRAPTTRTAAILLDQYHGALERAITTSLAALEESDLDKAGPILEELARHAPLGRHLTQPWRVAVLGPPNVGKSSLVNALAGFQRCVVSATPGTTRDVVTTVIAVEGWPVELSDTAGLRDEAEHLEAEGIQLARTAAEAADLCLWLLDASAFTPSPLMGEGSYSSSPLRGEGWGGGDLLQDKTTPHPSPPPQGGREPNAFRLIINKTDLPARWDLDLFPKAGRVSAQTGAGLPELCQKLAEWLVPQPPPPGAPVPFTAALCTLAEDAWRSFHAGKIDKARLLLKSMRDAPAQLRPSDSSA